MESQKTIIEEQQTRLEEPLITVIIPVCNVEAYLPTCLDSVIAQNYSYLDILLIDDGSTDQSGIICDQYAESDKRIRVIHQDNKGISRSRNIGLDSIRGEYFCFVDSDDWIEPSMVSELLNNITKTEASISTCKCFFEFKNSNSNKTTDTKEKMQLYSGTEGLGDAYYKDHVLGTASWGKLYRSGCLDGFRFPEDRYYEDWLLISWIISEGIMTVCTTKKLYHYRQRRSSIVNSRMSQKKALDNWIARKERYDKIGKLLPNYIDKMVYDCTIGIIQYLLNYNTFYDQKMDYLNDMVDFLEKNKKLIEREDYSLKNKYMLKVASIKSPVLWQIVKIVHDGYEIGLLRKTRQLRVLYP